ncbi:MAG: ABC transporter permease [Bifidobacteriaceae bacterium]|nr:ABC transporter permease [Bifidobacteriaceae bacterium]
MSGGRWRPGAALSSGRRTGPPANVAALAAGAWLAVMVLLSLVPGLEAAALAQDIAAGVSPPGSPGHLLGTDDLGRDVALLTLAGARTAIAGPVAIAAGSMAIGLLAGLVAAYRPGAVDWTVSRVVDVLLALPSLLLAIVVAGVIGGGYWISVAVFVVLYAPYDVRLVRAAALARINDPFLEAARLLGLPRWRILLRHLFPVIRGLVGANLFLNMAYALVSLSSLSFLGLGISPQAADWGRQLSDARTLMFSNPGAALAPGVAIILTAVALNLVGDWIAERSGVGEE